MDIQLYEITKGMSNAAERLESNFNNLKKAVTDTEGSIDNKVQAKLNSWNNSVPYTLDNITAQRSGSESLTVGLTNLMKTLPTGTKPIIGTYNSNGAMGAFFGFKLNAQIGTLFVHSYTGDCWHVTMTGGTVRVTNK